MVQQGESLTHAQGAEPPPPNHPQWEEAEYEGKDSQDSECNDILNTLVEVEGEDQELEADTIPSPGGKLEPKASVPELNEACPAPPRPTAFDTMGMLTNMAEANVRSTRGEWNRVMGEWNRVMGERDWAMSHAHVVPIDDVLT